MDNADILDKFVDFLNEFYKDELVKATNEGRKSINVDFSLLEKFDVGIADYLLENPAETMAVAQKAAKQIDVGSIDENFRIRFFNLPESRDIRIRNVRSEHLGKLIVVDGFIKRASEVRPEVSEAVFQCLDCGSNITIIQTERMMHAPIECENPACRNRKTFKLVGQKLYDARWAVVEEPFEITEGERPSDLRIYLKEDLTSPKMQNKTDPGNRIKVVGILKELPRRVKGSPSRQMEIYLDANHVESVETEWEELEINQEIEQKILELAKDPEIYTKLTNSIAPALYGLQEIKEAIVLQLFSGETHTQKDRSRVRGDIHVLLVGDPATSKSALMKVVSGLIPRGRYVSGKGVTGAGLTATVVKDEEFLGGWVLEAGALVMTNRSMCCLHPSTNFVSEKGLAKFSDLEKAITWKKAKSENEIFEIGDINQQLQSFDIRKLSVKTSDATLIRRKKFNGYLLELTLNSGNSLLLTPDHKLLDGDSLKWENALEFKRGDYLVAPLKLNSNSGEAYIFDLMPDDWLVCLTKEEKDGLKKQVLKNYSTLSEFNKKFRMDKNYLSGGKQFKKNIFQKIIQDLSVENHWKSKNLIYGRHFGSRRLKIAKATAELGYILGFIYGDAYINRKRDHAGFFLTQSKNHKKYTDKFVECFKAIFSEEPHHSTDSRVSLIRGRRVVSNSDVIYFGSNILIQIFDSLLGRKLEKITSVPKDALKGFIAGCFDSDGCISLKENRNYRSIDVQFLLSKNKESMLNFMLGLRCLDIYSKLKYGKNVKGVIISDVKNATRLKDEIILYSEKIKKELPERLHLVSSDSDKLPSHVISELSRNIADSIDTKILNSKGISSLIYDYINLKYQPSRDQVNKIIEKLRDNLSREHLEKLESIVKRDYFLDKIVKISNKRYKGYVYDFFVPQTHNFVSNGVFVHNCIDEFEKIEKTDQVALHEMMEQQTISIAKANIVATLPAMTSILAGGNPKLGRFDPYLPIKEQIDIPETILSRFDLKFALRDIPNPETDTKIAEHILQSRHFGEVEATPIINNDIFKKYVAYARKNCHPKLSREAADEIKAFYLSLRERSGEESPISITPRQYEALIRMAEAAAKIQLRNEVTKEDALRSINLMKASLRQFGFEPETGQIDIDRAEGARATSAQRSRIRIVLDILDSLEKTFGRDIPFDEVVKMARDQGVDTPDDILKKMQQEGMLYSSRPGFVSKV